MYEKFPKSDWFRKDRFGMFIHWGIYAVPSRGEWVKVQESLKEETYQHYFESFDPDLYDAREWAALAKKAGMKYAVLTAKHHDGFCLFDSKLTDYKATNTPGGRDLIKEYTDAFREAGLRVGLYYSLLDWHHPAYHDGEEIEGTRWNEYIEYYHGQVRELCTNYGKIDIMWFDFAYAHMTGERWEATKLIKMVQELQPGLMTDNRLEASGDEYGSIVMAEPNFFSGDFASPEQRIPTECICNELGEPVPWEACFTLNDHFGYAYKDYNYKSSGYIVRKLVECVSKSGNMLLNVGPTARGKIPKETQEILEGVGEWMEHNNESIYGCVQCSLPKPEWGRYTQKPGVLYAHIIDMPVGPIELPGIAEEDIDFCTLLEDGSEVPVINPMNGITRLKPLPSFMCDRPDTVIKIKLKKQGLI